MLSIYYHIMNIFALQKSWRARIRDSAHALLSNLILSNCVYRAYVTRRTHAPLSRL
ncbi:hypothetical protein [Choristoneura diversana nucleopolyhedrovirus]|nr:hypothetical protein [Choristoneura diversana nucleopolyhedrovirus]